MKNEGEQKPEARVIQATEGGDGGQVRELSAEAQKKIDHYLWKWLLVVGAASAAVGGLVVWAVTARLQLAEEQLRSAFRREAEIEIAKLRKSISDTDAVIKSTQGEMESAKSEMASAQETIEAEVRRARKAGELQMEKAADADRAVEAALRRAKQAEKRADDHLNAALGGGADAIAKQILKNDPTIKSSILLAAGLGVAPIGSIVAWPVGNSIPSGWEVCDGDRIAIHQGANDPPPGTCSQHLADILDASYGPVGTSDVTLPDFRGCFLRGLGKVEGTNMEKRKSAPTGQLQRDTVGASSNAWDGDHGGYVIRHSHRSTDARSVTETRPVNYAVHWLIRVR